MTSVLEKAVGDLANALEALESKLEDQIDSHNAARRQVKVARKHASDASSGLGAAISDVKALLEADDKSQEGNDGAS